MTRVDKRYVTESDVSSKLNGSVIRYKGIPAIVSNTEGFSLVISTIDKDGMVLFPQTVDVDDPDLDTSVPPLGYANYKKDAYFPQLLPEKNYKHGINYSCFRAFTPSGFCRTLPAFALPYSLFNSYPHMDEVWVDGNKSLAISPNLALSIVKGDKGIASLYLKRRQIGLVSKSDKVVYVLGQNLGRRSRSSIKTRVERSGYTCNFLYTTPSPA